MSITHEVEQYIKDWLEGDSGSEVVSWFVFHGLVDRSELRKLLLKMARDQNRAAVNTQFSFEYRTECLEDAKRLEHLASTL